MAKSKKDKTKSKTSKPEEKPAEIETETAAATTEETAAATEPETPEASEEEIKGVLFVRPARQDGPNMTPRYYDPRKEDVPPGARTGSVEYRRIADPDNPKIPLTIHSSKRIKNRQIVRYLLNKNRPANLKATTRGILLYDPQEVVDQGIITAVELEALNAGKPLDDCAPPPPIKNLGLMTTEAIDRWAMDREIPGYNITWSRKAKEQCVNEWLTGQFNKQ